MGTMTDAEYLLRTRTALFARCGEVYHWRPTREYRDVRLTWASNVLGRDIDTFKELDIDDLRALHQRITDDQRALEEPF